MKYPKHPPQARSGFTLTEMLVAVTIMGFVLAGTSSFFLQTGQVIFTSENKLLINKDIRSITNKMTDFARDSNHFTLYNSFYEGMQNPPSGMVHEDFRLRDSESGDFVVFIYYGLDPTPMDANPPPIERLVGFYRAVEDVTANTGPVRMFDIDIPSSLQDKKVEELIPTPAQEPAFRQVIELSMGLADGKLFYNFRDRSIMVNGQIIHGNKAKWVTDTYNFTISPRG